MSSLDEHRQSSATPLADAEREAQKMLAPAEDDGFGFSPSDDRPDKLEDTRRKKADLAAADEMETRRNVKQMVQHQWTKIWLRQQDIKQIEAGDFSSDVFTSFIDEASGLQSAFTVYYGFDPDLFWAAMIVYAVNVAGRLVLGLLAVVNVDWDEVRLVEGTEWRRVPGLLLMLIEPVSGNKLLESTLEARPTRRAIMANRRAADKLIAAALLNAEEAKRKLDREAKKLTNKANVEIVMALAEDVPELGLSAYWLATGGLDAMQTDSDASIVILSALISIFHMIKCIHRYRTIVQITKHAKTAGEEPTPQCCTPDLNDDFELETYGIDGTNGFTWGKDTKESKEFMESCVPPFTDPL